MSPNVSRLSRHKAGIVAAAVALALAGCAQAAPDVTVDRASGAVTQALQPLDQVQALADPAAYEGPTTASIPDADIDPIDLTLTQVLPATVTSRERDGDIQVTVEDTSRVIAMDISGSIAGTVYGLGFGDTLVARDVSTEFLSAVNLPIATAASHTINPEAVLEFNPTVVITDGSIGPSDSFQQLRDAGITVVYVDNDPSFAGAQEMARQVGAVFGADDAGEALAQRIGSEVAEVQAQIDEIAPPDADRLRIAFLYLRGSSGVYYLFGDESGADQLIDALGGVDAGGDAGIEGMMPLTDEAMLAADPDVIMVMSHGLESVGGVDGLLAAKPAIALTSAGQHRRFVEMADGDILSFGPRSAQIVGALARAIYAPDSE
ncbi:heme/hemin ABC transporter substrate-binding protein [Demequina aurantiaca]|uniref:heme/hemin ABC transporter substrate-binding protein n=1 Tax=Demequina aurantiaca TaxID=676200 RepID=UPI00078208AA|nr:ABC transporter substrate-binding protein [Demequina aurantiaca]